MLSDVGFSPLVAKTRVSVARLARPLADRFAPPVDEELSQAAAAACGRVRARARRDAARARVAQAREGRRVDVAHEDVRPPVRVARDEVRGVALEGDPSAVGRDRPQQGCVVALRASGAEARPHGRPVEAVAEEHVPRGVRVPGDQVPRDTRERHEASVAREPGIVAVVVARGFARGHAHELQRARLAVPQEHVPHEIPVAR
jgi:hypothetical protein